MRRYLLICLLILVTISANAQNTQLRKLDTLMNTANQRGIFNGNVLIAQHGKIIYQKSFGFSNVEKKTQLKATDKFDIGSISKEFNGVAIMKLQEMGKLSIEDPLQKYFP